MIDLRYARIALLLLLVSGPWGVGGAGGEDEPESGFWRGQAGRRQTLVIARHEVWNADGGCTDCMRNPVAEAASAAVAVEQLPRLWLPSKISFIGPGRFAGHRPVESRGPPALSAT